MLSLLRPTNAAWAPNAADALDRVMVDHAHCEMKAASNALALSARAIKHPHVIRALAEIAEEELRHFRSVLDALTARSLDLGTPQEDKYASTLLRRANESATHRSVTNALVDRLLVGALIEARSCERFKLLAEELRRREIEPELASFYEGLLASEARHHTTFVDLAISVSADAKKTKARFRELAEIESDVVAELTSEATIHG